MIASPIREFEPEGPLERWSDAATICYGSTRRVEGVPHKALAEAEAGRGVVGEDPRVRMGAAEPTHHLQKDPDNVDQSP